MKEEVTEGILTSHSASVCQYLQDLVFRDKYKELYKDEFNVDCESL